MGPSEDAGKTATWSELTEKGTLQNVIEVEFSVALLREGRMDQKTHKDHKDPTRACHNLIATLILIISVYNSEWNLNQLLAVNNITSSIKAK